MITKEKELWIIEQEIQKREMDEIRNKYKDMTIEDLRLRKKLFYEKINKRFLK